MLIHGIWHLGSLWAVLLGRCFRLPVILSMLGGEAVHLPHIGYGVIGKRHWRWILRRCLQAAQAVTVGSEYYRKRLVAFAPDVAAKLHLAPLGIQPPVVASSRQPGREFRLLVVAAMQPVKNLEGLLPVLAACEIPDGRLRITLAGEGPLAGRIQELLRRYPVDGKIVLSGWQPPERFQQEYGRHDLLLSASFHEAQGMAMVEAAAAGLPILATPVGVAAELKKIGAAVVTFDTVTQIPDKLDEMYRQRHKLRDKAMQARQAVINRYGLGRTAAAYLRLYAEAAKWYEIPLPVSMKFRRLLRPLLFRMLFPVLHFLRKRNAPTRVQGLEFDTMLEVFHPRYFFSSAVLVDYLNRLPMLDRDVLDMGTGSGVVGVCCARRGARVLAVDIHPAAVQLARRNAEKHGVAASMQCRKSDLFEAVGTGRSFDWVIFNPPFYPRDPRTLSETAFYGGRNARVLERFAAGAPCHLKPGGRVVLILSSDMPLREVHQMFVQSGFLLVDHAVKKHYFELFHLVQYGLHDE